MTQEGKQNGMLEDKDVEKWVNNGPTPEMIDKVDHFGERIGKDLKKSNKKDERVTTSQIRQIFSKMKSIEAKGFDNPGQRLEFMMLKPYLAYAAKRHDKIGLNELKERLTCGIDTVLVEESGQEQRFKNFCKLFEAILAYHKAHGGS
jgi:CRISPR-associated protein Csm2